MPDTTTTAQQMRQAIYRHFADRYAVMFEVTAADDGTWRGLHQRRIDALLVRRSANQKRPNPVYRPMARAVDEPEGLFPAEATHQAARPVPRSPEDDDGGLDRLALEIKVSRGDFLSDIRKPEKQAPWRALAHRHAYCVPEGLVRLDEVPSISGLLIVRAAGGCQWLRKAPRTDLARPLPLAIVLDAFYRCSRAEAAARGLAGSSRRLDSESALRLEVNRLAHEMELLNNRLERATDETTLWRRRCRAHNPLPCMYCGKPLRPGRRRTLGAQYLEWEHSRADEPPCLELRTQAAHDEYLKRTPDRRYGYFVPGPEPAYPGDDEPEITTEPRIAS